MWNALWRRPSLHHHRISIEAFHDPAYLQGRLIGSHRRKVIVPTANVNAESSRIALTYQRNLFMSSDCSIPALHARQPHTLEIEKKHRQSLRLLPQRVPPLLTLLIKLAHETHPQNQHIPHAELHALLLRTRLQLLDRYGVARPWIVREWLAICGVEADQIEKDTAAADAMGGPVYLS